MNLPVYRVRPMTVQDLEPVQAIDRLSFSLPWPASAFSYELTKSDHSHNYVVEEDLGAGAPQVVAMAVVWVIMDEAHIATIAVHPDWRGRGLGKLLLRQILADAQDSGLKTVLLEVRSGNQAAQALYHQFGFVVVGRRPRYYQDNQEDALLMTLCFSEPREMCQDSAGTHALTELEETS
jgi:ribosomal-protein-alanine N-acetyltransferase